MSFSADFHGKKIDLHTTDGILITFKTTTLLCMRQTGSKVMKGELSVLYSHNG